MISMYARIHTHGNERILAACDEDVMGLTFEGGGARIRISEAFYGKETITAEAFVERMKSVTIMNLVGEEVIALAIAEGKVSPDCVMDIGGVKHAQVVLL